MQCTQEGSEHAAKVKGAKQPIGRTFGIPIHDEAFEHFYDKNTRESSKEHRVSLTLARFICSFQTGLPCHWAGEQSLCRFPPELPTCV